MNPEGLQTIRSIIKAKRAEIGEIHHWATGAWRKTADGWEQVKQDVRRQLDHHNRREALLGEKTQRNQALVLKLDRRIERLKQEEPSERNSKEIAAAEKLRDSLTKKISSQKNPAKDRYRDKLEAFLLSASERGIREHHEPEIERKKTEIATLQQAIAEADIDQTDELEEKLEAAEEALLQLEDSISDAVEAAREEITSELDEVDNDSLHAQMERISENDLANEIIARYSGYPHVKEVDESLFTLRAIRQSEREALRKRKKMSDRLKIRRSVLMEILKGRRAAVGEVRHWKDGDYRKTGPDTWEAVPQKQLQLKQEDAVRTQGQLNLGLSRESMTDRQYKPVYQLSEKDRKPADFISAVRALLVAKDLPKRATEFMNRVHRVGSMEEIHRIASEYVSLKGSPPAQEDDGNYDLFSRSKIREIFRSLVRP